MARWAQPDEVVKLDARKSQPVLGNQPGQPMRGQRGQSRNSDPPFAGRRVFLQIQFDLSQLLHHTPRRSHESQALGGECDVPAITIHELKTDIILELAHHLAQRRLGNETALRRE